MMPIAPASRIGAIRCGADPGTRTKGATRVPRPKASCALIVSGPTPLCSMSRIMKSAPASPASAKRPGVKNSNAIGPKAAPPFRSFWRTGLGRTPMRLAPELGRDGDTKACGGLDELADCFCIEWHAGAPALLGCALLDLSGQQNLACWFERWRGLGPLREAGHVLVEAVVGNAAGSNASDSMLLTSRAAVELSGWLLRPPVREPARISQNSERPEPLWPPN